LRPEEEREKLHPAGLSSSTVRSAFGRRFDLPDGYLNTASIGVPPVHVADAVPDAVEAWRRGAAQPADFDPAVAAGRAAFADLLGVPVDRIAVGGSVSALVGLVAAAVPDGARVLVAEGEFTSVSFPFAAHAGRGVTVIEWPLERLGERAAEFDVVAASVVQSADGRLVDLDALRAVREVGTRVVLDATQSVGWLPELLGWADAVVCAGYKWLLCPRGVAWMAVHPELDLVPLDANWYAGGDVWASVYGLPLRLAGSARRFDTSPTWFSHVGAAVALPWLAGLNREAVHAHCVGLADAVRVGLGLEPAGSAIVALYRPDAAERLAAAKVVASLRSGAVRLAFHLYNTPNDVDRVLDALTQRPRH
jgi:selenocysteine lyase/cysteine desulfurase